MINNMSGFNWNGTANTGAMYESNASFTVTLFTMILSTQYSLEYFRYPYT